MKVAVTYHDGEVFQHFGKTENFKIYNVENKEILSSEIISSNGSGHGALAGVLAAADVNVLLCGGLGEGALNALTESGITVYSGASGDTDKVVQEYLAGNLIDAGVNCDHHEEEHSCGGGGCQGGCSGCGGGCHSHVIMEGRNAGKMVHVHYTGTLNDGTTFDSSYDRGEPLAFLCGAGMMIRGFDQAVANMEVGEIVDIHLTPEEAYGDVDPNAVFDVPISELPGSESLEIGQQVYLEDVSGQSFPVTVVAKENGTIRFDANHEMAGKELNFKIELIEVY